MSFFKTPPILGHKESYFPPIAGGDHSRQLLVAPAFVVAAGAYQIVKDKLATPGSDLKKQVEALFAFYQHLWKAFGKSEFRDKVGRVVQYACRGLQGFLAHQSKDFWLQQYLPAIAETQTTLAWARRTNRWGKEMPHIPTLGKALASGDWLQAVQSSVLITFLVQDHIYFLLKVGILKFQQYKAIEWHRRNLRFITLSHVLNFSLNVREISRIRAKQEKQDPSVSGSPEALEKADQMIRAEKLMMFRYVLTFIQMVHVSGVKQFDDWYIGIMGMISSGIDASKQW